MINLLFPADQKAIRAEYRHRLFVVGGWFVFGLILIALVIVGSFVFIISGRYNEVREQVAAAQREFAGDELAKARQTVEQANAATEVLLANPASESPIIVYRRLIDARGPGIRLTQIGFSSAGRGRVEITGQSATRAALLAYLDKLRTEPHFQSVDSPIKNIIRERDVAFTLTIVLASSPQ